MLSMLAAMNLHPWYPAELREAISRSESHEFHSYDVEYSNFHERVLPLVLLLSDADHAARTREEARHNRLVIEAVDDDDEDDVEGSRGGLLRAPLPREAKPPKSQSGQSSRSSSKKGGDPVPDAPDVIANVPRVRTVYRV